MQHQNNPKRLNGLFVISTFYIIFLGFYFTFQLFEVLNKSSEGLTYSKNVLR
jgi:hypothetical protein